MTPFCSASLAIATPVGPSSGHMMRTLAPRLMSAVASFSSVASLPCALSIRNCELVYPAAVRAFWKYGASKSTHRVDEVVSGRMTPTCRLEAPLVAAWVSGWSWDIVLLMSTVKSLVLSAGAELLADGDDEVAAGADVAGADEEDAEDVDEEQPEAITARPAARATTPSRGRSLNVPWPCERECPPPCL